MQFSWKILVVVFAVNSLCLLAMNISYFMDQLPPRYTLIPGTEQKYLYFQDFWTLAYGDVIFVPLIVQVFVHLVVEEKLTFRDWALGAMIAGACGLFFIQLITTSTHKPDFNNCLTGELNASGWVHVVYFSICWGVGLVCLAYLLEGNIDGPVKYAGLAGVALYFACQAADHLEGNFAQLVRM